MTLVTMVGMDFVSTVQPWNLPFFESIAGPSFVFFVVLFLKFLLLSAEK